MTDNIKSFLEELNLLTEKYKIIIGGCGCCGSPYLLDETNDKSGADNLEFDYETRKYKVEDEIYS